jgi:thioredoxin 1
MAAGFVRILSDARFGAEVLAPGRLALVAFGTSWCGPCGLMAPALRALAAIEKDRLMVAKLDAEADPQTGERYAVDHYPTCILFKGGEPIARLDGYMPLRKIQAELRPYLDAP